MKPIARLRTSGSSYVASTLTYFWCPVGRPLDSDVGLVSTKYLYAKDQLV